MNILCTLFGHQPPVYTEGGYGGQYMAVLPHGIDGIGREHADVKAKCPRCGELYKVGMIHLPVRHHEQVLNSKLIAEINTSIKARGEVAELTKERDALKEGQSVINQNHPQVVRVVEQARKDVARECYRIMFLAASYGSGLRQIRETYHLDPRALLKRGERNEQRD